MKVPGVTTSEIARELPFPIAEFESRLMAARERISERGLDALLVTIPENMYYLSGYHTSGYFYSQYLLVPLSTEPIFVVRATEETNVKALSWLGRTSSYMDHEDPIKLLATVVDGDKLGSARIGIEKNGWFTTISEYERLQERLPNAKLLDGSLIVEAGRMVKSEAEIAYIRKAAGFVEAGMSAAIRTIREGATENDVAAEIQHVMTTMGSEYPSLPVYVTSGPRSSFAHQTWAGRTLKKGDPLYLEFSGVCKRYSAAMMRAAVIGKPTKQIQRMYDVGRSAHEKMLSAIRPGHSLEEVWKAWADTLLAGGFQGGFKRCGYSVGVNFPPEWGEGYILSFRRGETTLLRPNMTFHATSMVKVFGVSDVSMSSTVRVTEQGFEELTKFEKRLFIC